jgi:hypothetical protein
MTRRSVRPFGRGTTLAALAASLLASVAATGCPGRPSERVAPETPAASAGPPATEELAPAPTAVAMQESSATYEVPIVAHPTEARPVYPAPVAEERPADTPERCLMLQVSPSSSSAYGLRGEVVQLVVRAQNGCGANFGSASFRVTAIGADGSPVGSASGRFSETIRPGGSAETLIAIPTKPSLGLTYRAEVTGY